MTRKRSYRRLELFALHARAGISRVDYHKLFAYLASLPAESRQHEDGDAVFAFPLLKMTGDLVFLIVTTGEKGTMPLVYDMTSGQEEVVNLPRNKFLTNRAHALINLDTREVIIEYNHRGAKASDIAHAIELIASARNPQEYSQLVTELNPIADVNFLEAIEQLGRIRVASVTVARPNPSWGKHVDPLIELAGESGAGRAETVLSADKGRSLSKEKGIVQLIMDWSKERLSFLKNAKLVGTKEGETAETTVSLVKYIGHQKVEVPLVNGHVETESIEKKMLAFNDSRSKNTDTDAGSDGSSGMPGDGQGLVEEFEIATNEPAREEEEEQEEAQEIEPNRYLTN